MISRRALLAAALALFAGGALAQAWPAKPIRIIVPFTPGGSTDILGRAIGQKLAESLGQQVVVENRAGAGGSIGAEAAARAAPDGYTLLMGHIGTLAVNPSLYPEARLRPGQELRAGRVGRAGDERAGRESRRCRRATCRQLVKLAREQPGRAPLRLGRQRQRGAPRDGVLQAPDADRHRATCRTRAPAPAVTDLLGGQVEVMMSGAPALMPHVRAGKLRALGVSSRAAGRDPRRPAVDRRSGRDRASRRSSGTGSSRRPGRRSP